MSVKELEKTLENRNNTRGCRIVSVTKRDSSQKGPKKIGLLKRFLGWIARGAEQMPTEKTSCST